MSRETKRAYLWLCPENDEKKNLVHKGLRHLYQSLSNLNFAIEKHKTILLKDHNTS